MTNGTMTNTRLLALLEAEPGRLYGLLLKRRSKLERQISEDQIRHKNMSTLIHLCQMRLSRKRREDEEVERLREMLKDNVDLVDLDLSKLTINLDIPDDRPPKGGSSDGGQ